MALARGKMGNTSSINEKENRSNNFENKMFQFMDPIWKLCRAQPLIILRSQL